MKLFEMERGRGWNWEERARVRAMRIGKTKSEEPEDVKEEDGGNKESPREFWVDEPEMGLENVQWVVVDKADVLFDPDFQESTRVLLADIAISRGFPVPVIPSSALSSTSNSEATAVSIQSITYPFNFVLTSATIPTSLATYLFKLPPIPHPPRIPTAASPPSNRHGQAGTITQISNVVSVGKVEQLAAFFDGRGIKCVALTGSAETGRFLDFPPMIKHMFIVDEPRNMIDFLHRAGRVGKAGKVVVFGRAKGRGSGRTEEVKQKVRAVTG
ncbi:hypothetical protein BDR04DRAFT_1117061 [Suillus decipiens]|nr:hypothetical protein BDR04DRAFT_1117061 [Suillus decipiens]